MSDARDRVEHVANAVSMLRPSFAGAHIDAAAMLRAQHEEITRLRAALSAPPPVVPAGMVWVSVELLQDAARSIDDYRGGLEFSSHDRRLIGRLKAAADQSQPQR